jgi:hypothetical protein
MLKHIGRHGDRKVAILFREVPGEDHMCLVIYPETLPTHIHDSIMKTLESPVGQQANNLADALHRGLLPDGRPQLEALHREGMIKKIPSSQVIVTPNATSSVKLDELNRIVREMETGDDARKRLEQLDNSKGMVDPSVKRDQEREYKRRRLEQEAALRDKGQIPPPMTTDGALDNKALATNMLAQAKKMESEAKGLISEAARMKKEAQRMYSNVNLDNFAEPAPVSTTAAKTTKRGRPKAKAVTADAIQ